MSPCCLPALTFILRRGQKGKAFSKKIGIRPYQDVSTTVILKKWGLRRGIWKAKVYYLNDRFNYDMNRLLTPMTMKDSGMISVDSAVAIIAKTRRTHAGFEVIE